MLKRIMAVILAVLIMNTLCFLYYNPLHGSDLNNYRLEPNTIGLNAVEGLAVLYSDSNGFSNEDIPLAEDGYILVMGSSQSKADQVSINERYSGLMNHYLGYEDELGVYNLAYNGGGFEDIVKNFNALITEFPNSKAIIIEVTDSQLLINEVGYQNAMLQVDYNDSVTREKLNEHDAIGNIKLFIKKYCPLLLLYVKQYTQWKQTNYIQKDMSSMQQENLTVDTTEYQQYVNMLRLIREQYDREIIVVYHNGFSFDADNRMDTTLSKTGQVFKAACNLNGIEVVDMTMVFSKHFDNYSEIPYGFWNTSMGTGHLNAIGHKLIAEELYEYFSGENE